jgi:hypothetical protein
MKQHLDQILALSLKFFSMLFLILLPIRSVMIAVSILVVADLISGIGASLKEKQKITSNALRRTVVKTLAYQASVIISFVIETYLLEGMPVVKVVAGLIAVTEGKSFFENMHRITGIDFWSEILEKVHASNEKPVARKRRKK